MLELKAQPLTAAAFADFGDVIDSRTADSFAINGGRAQRFHDLVKIETLGDEARPLVSIFISEPVDLPLQLTYLERHPLGSQAFIPMHEERFVVVVAPKGEAIDPDNVRAFVTDGRQGVNYRAGIWHGVQSVIERKGEFVVVDRGGKGKNCDEYPMDVKVIVEDAVVGEEALTTA